MALRRNAPDKVKLKLRGDGPPQGDLGNDLLREQPDRETPAAEIRDRDGRALLDWSGGDGAAGLRHAVPEVNEKVVVAGLGALALADPEAHARVVELTTRLAMGLGELASGEPPVAFQVQSQPGLVGLRFSDDPGGEVQAAFFRGMEKRGIRVPRPAGSPWIVSAAHDRAAVDRTVMAAADALGEAA